MGSIVIPGSSDIGSSSSPIIIKPSFSWDVTAQGYVDRSFGIFLHFNMSTFTNVEVGNPASSENLFDPGSGPDIDQWVTVILAAKAKYAALTVKHHDGFCLWPTATTTHSIANSSWYAAHGSRDIVLEFVTKCRAAGIVPVLYFSILDLLWQSAHDLNNGAAYSAYLNSQIAELLTNYGPIAALWIDGTEWYFNTKPNGYPWASSAARDAVITGYQPNCLTVNNGHTGLLADSRVIEYEGGSFGASVPGGNTDPAEACDTLRGDNNWFWKAAADTPLSASTVLSTIAALNAKNATFLLNAGPNNLGLIPDEMVAVLEDVGAGL